MRKITFQELRRNCASLLLKSGVPMKERKGLAAAMTGKIGISVAIAAKQSHITQKNAGKNCPENAKIPASL